MHDMHARTRTKSRAHPCHTCIRVSASCIYILICETACAHSALQRATRRSTRARSHAPARAHTQEVLVQGPRAEKIRGLLLQPGKLALNPARAFQNTCSVRVRKHTPGVPAHVPACMHTDGVRALAPLDRHRARPLVPEAVIHVELIHPATQAQHRAVSRDLCCEHRGHRRAAEGRLLPPWPAASERTRPGEQHRRALNREYAACARISGGACEMNCTCVEKSARMAIICVMLAGGIAGTGKGVLCGAVSEGGLCQKK